VLGKGRGEGRERGFMCPQNIWDRAKEPRSGAREEGSLPLGFRLMDVCSKVRFRTAYNRAVNCCPLKN